MCALFSLSFALISIVDIYSLFNCMLLMPTIAPFCARTHTHTLLRLFILFKCNVYVRTYMYLQIHLGRFGSDMRGKSERKRENESKSKSEESRWTDSRLKRLAIRKYQRIFALFAWQGAFLATESSWRQNPSTLINYAAHTRASSTVVRLNDRSCLHANR